MPQRNGSVTVTKSLAMNREEIGAIIGIKGELIGQYIRFRPNERLLIGRDHAQCDVLMHSPFVSSVHCEIWYDSSRKAYIVTDKSKNGVVVDSKYKLNRNEPTEVAPGSHLMIGDTENEVVLG